MFKNLKVFINKDKGLVFSKAELFTSVDIPDFIRVEGQGVARCHTEFDSFDPRIGKKLANLRAEKMAYKLLNNRLRQLCKNLLKVIAENETKVARLEVMIDETIEGLK